MEPAPRASARAGPAQGGRSGAMPPPLETPTGSSSPPPPPPKRRPPVIDTSAPALAASLRKLRDVAELPSTAAHTLRRADRLLNRAVMEDIQLGASVAVGAAKGLGRDKAGLTPRETSLGSTVWGRRVSAQPFTVAVRAAIGSSRSSACASPTYPRACSRCSRPRPAARRARARARPPLRALKTCRQVHVLNVSFPGRVCRRVV